MAGSAVWTGTPSIRGSSDTVRMALLTICLAGVQFTWGIEMAYCTPYLLSLGVSKSKTSLVWIAGPLSGLITQPIVGVLADRSRLRWGRRRPFMIGGSILVSLALLILGWTSEVVGWFTKDEATAKNATVVVAVFSIYALDFAVNAVQAGCRAIIVDTLSIPRQQRGSAWASRMIAAGHVISYFAGMVDLMGIFGTWFLGGTQFKKLCVISSVALLVCVSITSYAVTERVLVSRRDADVKEGIFHVFVVIWKTLWSLPNRIAAICGIQFWAWLGWFPFLFYSSTWVGEVYQRYDSPPPDPKAEKSKDAVADIARIGSMALVVFSLVSLAGSISLPWLVVSPQTDRQRPPNHILIKRFLAWVAPFRPTLSTAWMASHAVFGVAMMFSVFARTVHFATSIVAVCGVPWAVTCWAPFALVGEEINRISSTHRRAGSQSYMRGSTDVYDRLQHLADNEDGHDSRFSVGGPEDAFHDSDDEDDEQGKNASAAAALLHAGPNGDADVELGTLNPPSPNRSRQNSMHTSRSVSPAGTRSPTLHIIATPEQEENEEATNSSTGELAGVYLGILNLFITLPQFVASFVAFVVFAILEPGKSPELAGEKRGDAVPAAGNSSGGGGSGDAVNRGGVNAIAVTLFLGGIGSIYAAWKTRKLKYIR